MKEFLQTTKQAATGIPGIHPGIAAAQAALESNFGKSQLAQQANNLFGVKVGSSWNGASITMRTMEEEFGEFVEVAARWRKYPAVRDAIEDYAALIRRVYPHAAAVSHDGEAYARALTSGVLKYATDSRYSEKLITLATQHNLLEPIRLFRLYANGVEIFRHPIPPGASVVTNASPDGTRYHTDIREE